MAGMTAELPQDNDTGQTILVVDDMSDNIILISLSLQDFGYRVVTATNGADALNVAKMAHPDLILMDIAMPGMNGITAAREIRTFEHCINTPMIAVTAYGNIYEEEALDAGFNEVIPKPLGFEDIKPLIERYLTAH